MPEEIKHRAQCLNVGKIAQLGWPIGDGFIIDTRIHHNHTIKWTNKNNNNIWFVYQSSNLLFVSILNSLLLFVIRFDSFK